MNVVKPWMNATTNVAKVALTDCIVASIALMDTYSSVLKLLRIRQQCLRVYILAMLGSSLGARPLKNWKGGSGTSAGVEVYTAPGMKAHFRLAFD